MRRQLPIAISVAIAALMMLGGATSAHAAPGSLRILFDSNQGDGSFTTFLPALRSIPGVATVDTFDSSAATPPEGTFAGHDLVVNAGDSFYDDPVLYGDRLARYIDAGGAVIQFAYDNWQDAGAHPEGRFQSEGYAPFVPGPNDNLNVTLGDILAPGNPLLAGVPSFTSVDNTTDALAPGATLLAKWSDDRNAIASRGQVVSVTASPEDGGSLVPISAAAQLAVNAGKVLGLRTVTVRKAGAGSGTVTGTGTGINCGATCAVAVGGSQTLTLTATVSKGTFTGWSGGGCSGTSTCTPEISGGDATVTATFDACVVPKLKGKRLKKAKSKLRKRDCRLGKVKHKGAGKVKGQKPKPGKVLPVGTKVKVTLR